MMMFSSLTYWYCRHELALRLGNDPDLSGIRVIGLDPGGMSSGLLRRGPMALRIAIKIAIPLMSVVSSWLDPNPTMRTTTKSGADVVRACYDIEGPEKGELLYLNGTAVYETSKDSKDKEKSQRLWVYGLEAGGIKPGDTVLQKWQ